MIILMVYAWLSFIYVRIQHIHCSSLLILSTLIDANHFTLLCYDDRNDKGIGSYTQVCLTSAKVLNVTRTGVQPPTWQPFSILDTCTRGNWGRTFQKICPLDIYFCRLQVGG